MPRSFDLLTLNRGVSVVLESNRAEGVARGSIAGLLYLEDLDTSTEVNVSDAVITSGLGGSYFRGVARLARS